MIKRLLFKILLSLSISLNAQVGIGTATPDPASVLDVNSQIGVTSTFGGLKLPTVINAQRANIVTPIPEGLLIFNSEERCIQIYNSNASAWENIYCLTGVNNAPLATNINLTGISIISQQLSGSYAFTDSESDPEGTSLYKWFRADNNSGLNAIEIPGANLQTYTLVAADETKFIAFEVTPIASSGNLTGVPIKSPYIGEVKGSVTYLAFQDFDGNTTWNYTSDVLFFDNGTDGFYGITNALNNILNTTNYIGLFDLNDEDDNGTSGFATVSFDTINVAGHNNVTMSFDYEIFGFDNGDDVYYTVTINGVEQTEVFLIDGTNELSQSATVTVNIPDGSTSVALKFRVKQNGIEDAASFDNFRVYY
jgi:hypothetical protein